MTSSNSAAPKTLDLTRYAWLSIATGFVVFGLKLAVFAHTHSVGLLSDALESSVNIVAAVIALIALKTAMKPADERYHFGHGKAEYFSAQIEGFMILLAAVVIVGTAIERLIHPVLPDNLGSGLLVYSVASAINGAVAFILMRAARKYRSPVLDADGRHLLTDVWTSVGVLVGVGAVSVTHWVRLDALVALAVGVNIIITGVNLLRESTGALMDKALPEEDHDAIVSVLKKFESETVKFHAIQTRQSGRHRFVSMHVLVPAAWTIQQGHDLSEDLEAQIIDLLPDTTVHTHVEPIEDPRSWQDEHDGQYRWS